MKPVEIVGKLFEAFGKQDFEGVRVLLDPKVEWVVTGDPEIIPWAGTFKGPDAVLKLMSNNSGSTENLKITTKWTVDDDQRVIMLINEQATVGGTGEFYEVDSVHIYTVKDDKVIKFENHFNPLPVLQATFGKISFAGLKKQTNLNLKSEEWLFFDADNKYHHREEFLHEYDNNGRRIKGQLINHGRDIRYNMYYQYDEKGTELTQRWENTNDPGDVFNITNHFNNSSNVIIGGKGVGNDVSWEYLYDYDQSGRKIRMSNTYSNGNSWIFEYKYDDQGLLVLGEGTASTGLTCRISYKY